jgi:hypothetical protein
MEKAKEKVILTWPEAFEADRVCRRQGWNLARLVRYGFPVPVGGVLVFKLSGIHQREPPSQNPGTFIPGSDH